MSAQIFKTFIYTEAASGRILAIKRSSRHSFLLSLPGVLVLEFRGPVQLGTARPLQHTFSLAVGVGEAREPAGAELSLLKKKVDTLILVKANLNGVEQQIQDTFSDKAIARAPLLRRDFRLFWKFMKQEKRIVRARARKFFEEFQGKVSRAGSVQEVEGLYEWLTLNVNLGVYSVTNQERKSIDAL